MSEKEKAQLLADELTFILKGLVQGTIKSQPIIDTSDENSTEWPMMTLAEHIEVALNRAGFSLMELGKKKVPPPTQKGE